MVGVDRSSSRCASAFGSRLATSVLSVMAVSRHYWIAIARGFEDSRLPTRMDKQPLA